MTKNRLHHTCFREKAQIWWLIRYLGDDGTCGGPKPHFGRKRWIETWYTSPRRCLEFSMRLLYCKTRELKVLQQLYWSELLGQGVNCNIIMKLQWYKCSYSISTICRCTCMDRHVYYCICLLIKLMNVFIQGVVIKVFKAKWFIPISTSHFSYTK